jgi:hypothetical protein
MMQTDIVHLLGIRVATHTAQLDVDDSAGAQLNGCFRIGSIMNAFI